jgi:hypothetical protein
MPNLEIRSISKKSEKNTTNSTVENGQSITLKNRLSVQLSELSTQLNIQNAPEVQKGISRISSTVHKLLAIKNTSVDDLDTLQDALLTHVSRVLPLDKNQEYITILEFVKNKIHEKKAFTEKKSQAEMFQKSIVGVGHIDRRTKGELFESQKDLFDLQNLNQKITSPDYYYGGTAKHVQLHELGGMIGGMNISNVENYNQRKKRVENLEENLSEQDKIYLEKNQKGQHSEDLVGKIPRLFESIKEYPQILATIQVPPFSHSDTKNKIDTIFVVATEKMTPEMNSKTLSFITMFTNMMVAMFEIEGYKPFGFVQKDTLDFREIREHKMFETIEFYHQKLLESVEQFELALQSKNMNMARKISLEQEEIKQLIVANFMEIANNLGINDKIVKFKGVQVKSSIGGKHISLAQKPNQGVLLPPDDIMVKNSKNYHTNSLLGKETKHAIDTYLAAFESVLGL